MPRGAAELINRIAVPIELEPPQRIENCVDRFRGRSLPVGVLDPQHKSAAATARVEPAEQRGARTTNVEEPSRRGGEARDDSFSFSHRRSCDVAIEKKSLGRTLVAALLETARTVYSR